MMHSGASNHREHGERRMGVVGEGRGCHEKQPSWFRSSLLVCFFIRGCIAIPCTQELFTCLVRQVHAAHMTYTGKRRYSRGGGGVLQ